MQNKQERKMRNRTGLISNSRSVSFREGLAAVAATEQAMDDGKQLADENNVNKRQKTYSTRSHILKQKKHTHKIKGVVHPLIVQSEAERETARCRTQINLWFFIVLSLLFHLSHIIVPF